jgi:hypothetical protein
MSLQQGTVAGFLQDIWVVHLLRTALRTSSCYRLTGMKYCKAGDLLFEKLLDGLYNVDARKEEFWKELIHLLSLHYLTS